MEGEDRRTAIVTGASRGIGKASAIALAAAGYDVAITARTRWKNDRAMEPSGTVAERLPGSLEETADIISSHGVNAYPIYMDLLEQERLIPAAEEAISKLGHVDVLVNNAVYSGPGNYSRFLDGDLEDVSNRIFGNITAQLFFMQPVLSTMVEQGSGTMLFMSSAAAYSPPFAMPGEGGWGLAYTVSKGGFHRLAIQLAYEYGQDGITALNLQPGFVATERVKLVQGPVANIAAAGVEPSIIGAVVAHVARNAKEFSAGSMIQLQDIASELGLLPDSSTC
ncbi:MAG: SDR family NAD(P)-dependent oxidoreductase [Acidimicrobiales bacterium]|nr:SDR family oxidoreductase [Acidimicrobiales bacterium]MDG1489247.1 SDR family NAD(P)-dependent oxidoreductase [Actinomycetota bacterium]MDG1846600.1 SDR family NAD(P)-dependent oxidoreductase [Acidimicrobiales bacterium]